MPTLSLSPPSFSFSLSRFSRFLFGGVADGGGWRLPFSLSCRRAERRGGQPPASSINVTDSLIICWQVLVLPMGREMVGAREEGQASASFIDRRFSLTSPTAIIIIRERECGGGGGLDHGICAPAVYRTVRSPTPETAEVAISYLYMFISSLSLSQHPFRPFLNGGRRLRILEPRCRSWWGRWLSSPSFAAGTPPIGKDSGILTIIVFCCLGLLFFGIIHFLDSDPYWGMVFLSIDSITSSCWRLVGSLDQSKSPSLQYLLGVFRLQPSVGVLGVQSPEQIAVKRLKVWSNKAEMQFAVEVEILGRVRHKNLLSLRGYCAEGQERLIVYDYMPNLSLLSHLHGQHSSECLLNWGRRMSIAIGSAEGIAYLHHYAIPHIIHRDIKASNVLLDSDFQARVADFGFAKLIPDGATHVTTRVKGTLGYLAPEYAMFGKASESCDVYSFGILLLELAGGKKPLEKLSPTVKRSIVDWALPLARERRFREMADPKLNGNFVEDELKRMVLVALVCAHCAPEKRPTMQEVVDLLKGELKEKMVELENDEIFKTSLCGDVRGFSIAAGDSSDCVSEEKDSKGDTKKDTGPISEAADTH
ncbi:PTI1-like tyrosine-protein kinase [Apostasia shenzhenica]|uniref:PTI1-like tyrosine-protein kinase n=1 Tax=Apostasia shenzhenica TaxID=1088818 RepID=A0A2I0A7H7_9ASPA|nr:PTI1-like tyrosine-protein kinase [Apostasia shenzhenica]